MKLKAIYTCFYLSFLTAGQVWASHPANAGLNQIDFDHLEESTLFFKALSGTDTPTPLKLPFYEAAYVGTLKSSADDVPNYFLMTGKPCQTCQDDRTLYAVRPSGGKPDAYVYPGKIFDPKNRALLLESRAFYGHCLARPGDQYVVFQRERVDRRSRLQESVLVVEPGSSYLRENLIERHLPRLANTLKMVKKKQCHEIEGRNRLMLKKPLDLNTRPSDSDDGDDSDDQVGALIKS